jgi:alpha-amylase
MSRDQAVSTELTQRVCDRPGTATAPTPVGIADAEESDAEVGEPVALQYFDYHEPDGPEGDHWRRIAREAGEIASSGYDAVWVQPPTEPVTPESNGYNPRNHLVWDSPLGSESDFEGMVDALAESGHGEVGVYIDAIVNHTGTKDPGDGVYEHLDSEEFYHHPHADGRTTMQLFDLWDLDQTHGSVTRHLRAYVEKIAQMGCAGVRWDAAKHVPRWYFEEYLNDWVDQHDLFRVGEVFDGSVDFLESYVDTGMNCFDYPLWFTMQDSFRREGDFRWLKGCLEHGDCLLSRNSYHTSTFVSNHDEEAPPLDELAYAFILTAPGYPIVYTNHAIPEAGVDYAAPWLQNLIWIKRTLASGELYVRHADRDLFVHERFDSLLTGINKADNARTRWVYTSWEDTPLYDYTGTMGERRTDEDGWVELTVPAGDWVCYAPY